MSTAPKIGIVASTTEKLVVQRQGEQFTLRQGDAILAGDVVQNKDLVPVDIELPALTEGQADSLVTLAPESAAQIASNAAANGAVIEVTSLTDGVDLYAISDGTDGAILLTDAGTGFNGLVGAGLLSAGSAGGVGSLATVVGGGVGVAALAASSGDDSNSIEGATFTDVRVDNGDETSEPVDEPVDEPEDETPNEEEPETPEEPVDEGTTGTPLDAVIDPLLDAVASSPIGSAPNPLESLPLDAITSNLPV